MLDSSIMLSGPLFVHNMKGYSLADLNQPKSKRTSKKIMLFFPALGNNDIKVNLLLFSQNNKKNGLETDKTKSLQHRNICKNLSQQFLIQTINSGDFIQHGGYVALHQEDSTLSVWNLHFD